jgi:transcriptional regulator with XRE-family HTH domain
VPTSKRSGRATPKRAGRNPQPGSRFLSDAFAENLHAYRSLRRWSQEELARRMVDLGHASWSRATVSEVERGGRTVTIDELLALAMAFGVPIGNLLDPAGLDGRATAPLDVGIWRPMPIGVASRWVRGRIGAERTPGGVLVSRVEEFDPAAEHEAARKALKEVLEHPGTEPEEGPA